MTLYRILFRALVKWLVRQKLSSMSPMLHQCSTNAPVCPQCSSQMLLSPMLLPVFPQCSFQYVPNAPSLPVPIGLEGTTAELLRRLRRPLRLEEFRQLLGDRD